MTFDFTINVGTIMELATIIAGGLWFMITMNTKLSILIVERKQEHTQNLSRFEDIEKQLERLVDVTSKIAVQEERINALDSKFTDFILNGKKSTRRSTR